MAKELVTWVVVVLIKNSAAVCFSEFPKDSGSAMPEMDYRKMMGREQESDQESDQDQEYK